MAHILITSEAKQAIEDTGLLPLVEIDCDELGMWRVAIEDRVVLGLQQWSLRDETYSDVILQLISVRNGTRVLN